MACFRHKAERIGRLPCKLTGNRGPAAGKDFNHKGSCNR